MISLRNNSLVAPSANWISVKDLAAQQGFSLPVSLRGLLSIRDMSQVVRYGVFICTEGTTRKTIMPVYWFDRAFLDIQAIAAFIRQMSGGRAFVEWEVFDAAPLITPAQKAITDPKSAADKYKQTASDDKYPTDFQRFMWVVDDGVSKGGVSPGVDALIGASDIAVRSMQHEITHAFGVCAHADYTTINDYGDIFCILGGEDFKRSFENPRLEVGDDYPHHSSGPGIIAPYLFVLGWLNYDKNVVGIGNDALEENTGAALITIFANQGAPPPDSDRPIALALGNIPTNVGDPSQFWVEYRHPSRWDSTVDKLLGFVPPHVPIHVPDLPSEGVVMLHELSRRNDIGGCNGNQPHTFLRKYIGVTDSTHLLEIPELGVAVRVVTYDVNEPSATLVIQSLS